MVVASEILARACFEEGRFAQSFSIFGGERRGAPLAAFVRISAEKIYLKCDIEHPDHLIVFDESLYAKQEIEGQLVPGGKLLLNAPSARRYADLPRHHEVGLIDAFAVAQNAGLRNIVNTAVLGAYVRLSGVVGLETVLSVIADTVPAARDENLAAAREAYRTVTLLKPGT